MLGDNNLTAAKRSAVNVAGGEGGEGGAGSLESGGGAGGPSGTDSLSGSENRTVGAAKAGQEEDFSGGGGGSMNPWGAGGGESGSSDEGYGLDAAGMNDKDLDHVVRSSIADK